MFLYLQGPSVFVLQFKIWQYRGEQQWISVIATSNKGQHTWQYNCMLIFEMHVYITRALQCLSCSSASGNIVEDTSEYLSILPGTKDNINGNIIICWFLKCIFISPGPFNVCPAVQDLAILLKTPVIICQFYQKQKITYMTNVIILWCFKNALLCLQGPSVFVLQFKIWQYCWGHQWISVNPTRNEG